MNGWMFTVAVKDYQYAVWGEGAVSSVHDCLHLFNGFFK